MSTGQMLALLECKENAVPAGVFFGSAQPNNWGIAEKEMTALCEGNPSPVEMSALAFGLYARLHGTYWRDSHLLRTSWLRAADWYSGKGREQWEQAMKMSSDAWAAVKADIAAGTSAVQWDDHLVA